MNPEKPGKNLGKTPVRPRLDLALLPLPRLGVGRGGQGGLGEERAWREGGEGWGTIFVMSFNVTRSKPLLACLAGANFVAVFNVTHSNPLLACLAGVPARILS